MGTCFKMYKTNGYNGSTQLVRCNLSLQEPRDPSTIRNDFFHGPFKQKSSLLQRKGKSISLKKMGMNHILKINSGSLGFRRLGL